MELKRGYARDGDSPSRAHCTLMSRMPSEILHAVLCDTLAPGDRAIAARVSRLWRHITLLDHASRAAARARSARARRDIARAVPMAVQSDGENGDDHGCDDDTGQEHEEDAIDETLYDFIDDPDDCEDAQHATHTGKICKADDPEMHASTTPHGTGHNSATITLAYNAWDRRQRQRHRRRKWLDTVGARLGGVGDACRRCGDISLWDDPESSIDPDECTHPAAAPLPTTFVLRASTLAAALAHRRPGSLDQGARITASAGPASSWPPPLDWRVAHGWPSARNGDSVLDWALDEARCPPRCLFMAACAAGRADLLDLITAFGWVDAAPLLCPRCAVDEAGRVAAVGALDFARAIMPDRDASAMDVDHAQAREQMQPQAPAHTLGHTRMQAHTQASDNSRKLFARSHAAEFASASASGWVVCEWPSLGGFGPAAAPGRASRTLVRAAVDCVISCVRRERGAYADVLSWLLTSAPGHYVDPYARAARHGRVDILDWLWQARCELGAPHALRTHVSHHMLPCVAEDAAYGGRIRVLRWLLHRAPETIAAGGTCAEAARGSRWRTLRWLRAWTAAPWDQETMRLTAARGNLAMVEWLYTRGCPSSHRALDAAIVRGHFDVAVWLHARGHRSGARALVDAAYSGHTRIVAWLIGLQDTRHHDASDGTTANAIVATADALAVDDEDDEEWRWPHGHVDPEHVWRSALSGARFQLALAHQDTDVAAATALPVLSPSEHHAGSLAGWPSRERETNLERAQAAAVIAASSHPMRSYLLPPSTTNGAREESSNRDETAQPDPSTAALTWLEAHGAAPRNGEWPARALQVAIEYGATLCTLRWLRARGCPWSAGACAAAAEAGRSRVLVWLINSGCPWIAIRLIPPLARRGLVDQLDWLSRLTHASTSDVGSAMPAAALSLAAERVPMGADAKQCNRAGKTMITVPRPTAEWQACAARACELAAIEGRSRVIWWARERAQPPWPWDAHTTAAAAEGGHLALLAWLRDPGTGGGVCPWDASCYHGAAFYGHVEIIDWLADNGCPLDALACVYAAKGGRIDALRALRRRGVAWTEAVCAKAAAYGRMTTLRWMRDPCAQGGTARICPWDEQTVRDAVENDNWDIASWALDHQCPCDSQALAEEVHLRMQQQTQLALSARVDPAWASVVYAGLAARTTSSDNRNQDEPRDSLTGASSNTNVGGNAEPGDVLETSPSYACSDDDNDDDDDDNDLRPYARGRRNRTTARNV